MWRFQLGDPPDAGEIDCKPPGLQLLRHKAMRRLQSWPENEFLHMERECNQSADLLARSALLQETGTIATSDLEIQHLVSLNRSGKLIVQEMVYWMVKMAAIT